MESLKPSSNTLSKGINVVIPSGVNQLYSQVHKKYLSCEEMFHSYLEINIKDRVEEYYASSLEWSVKETDKTLWGFLSDKLGIVGDPLENNFFEFVKNEIVGHKDFYIIEKDVIEEIVNKGHKIILLHENKLSFYIESLILGNFPSYSELIVLKLKDDNFQSEVKLKPREYVFFDHRISKLLEYKNLGSWVVYLTHYIFTSYYVLKKSSPLYPLNEENLQLLSKQGRFFDFSTHTFFQLRNYYKYIAEVYSELENNTDPKELLEAKINETNPVRVLTIYKSFFKKGELKKTLHFTSNEKVFFVSHCGGNIDEGILDVDLEVNGKFEVIISRMSEAQEVKSYSKLVEKVENYPLTHPEVLLLNSSRNLPNLMNRDLMIEFLNKFCVEEKLEAICSKYNTKVIIPNCYPVTLREVYEADQLRQFLDNKKLHLPLIIKYSGPRTDFNHLLITIITEEGLDNYVKFMKAFSEGHEDHISMIIQSYVNHGGYVIKLYRVNRKGIIYTRPSLPDVSEELVKQHEEYSQGFYKIYTNELVSHEYTEFWKKLAKNQKVLDSINKDLLNETSEIFEDFSHMTLFGLDFLYDIDRNEYYLVDCNNFPGYKELVNEFNNWIVEHVLTYHNQFKQTGRIFSKK